MLFSTHWKTPGANNGFNKTNTHSLSSAISSSDLTAPTSCRVLTNKQENRTPPHCSRWENHRVLRAPSTFASEGLLLHRLRVKVQVLACRGWESENPIHPHSNIPGTFKFDHVCSSSTGKNFYPLSLITIVIYFVVFAVSVPVWGWFVSSMVLFESSVSL